MFESFPNTNFHELNLDWILEQIKEFRTWFDNLNVEDEIKKDVDKYFNEVMVQAIYDKDSKTITLQKQLSGDGVHTYDAGTLTMKIGGDDND